MRVFRGVRRLFSVGLPALLVTVLCMESALAAFPSDPTPQAWVADAPVHALLTSGDLVFVGTGGGVRAISGTNGVLEWSVPTDGDVRALALSGDGTVLFVGGGFLNAAGSAHEHLAALSAADGTEISGWHGRAAGMVRDLVVRGDRLYVGGTFASIGGAQQAGLGALSTATGQRIGAFDASTDGNVYGLALSGDQLVVSGRFTQVNGSPRSSLAAVDLASGTLSPWSPGRLCSTCNTYWDVGVDANNAYVASSGPGGRLGAFNLNSGREAWHFIRTDGDVQAVTVADDGLVYAGGHFGRFAGSADRHMLFAADRATGQVEGTFAPWPYTTYPGIWALATNSNTLYAGGNFTGVRSGGSNNHVPYFTAFRDPNLTPPPPPPPPPAPTTPPVNRGVWAFDEVSGGVAHDSSSFGNDGAIHGAVLGRAGRVGTSFRFDDNAYVLVPSRSSLNPRGKDFTFSAFVNFMRRPAAKRVYVVARKGVVSTSGGEFRLEVTHAGRARCVVRDSSGLSRQVIGPVTSLANGRWHKVKCRRVGSTLSVVVDGVVRSKTVSLGSVSNRRALVVGSSYGKASGLHGRVDAVRLRIG